MMKNICSINRPKYFVILFGNIDYDGRVKRMIDILRSLGQVNLIDIMPKGKSSKSIRGITRESIVIPDCLNYIIKHLFFWLFVLYRAFLVKPNVIVAEDYFTCFPAWIATIFTRAKYVYDAHELITPDPNCPVNLRNYFWYLMEKYTIKRATLIVAANKERAERMAGHYKLCNLPVVMRNIPPKINVKCETTQLIHTFPELKRRNKFDHIIIYQGYISLSRGIDKFIGALEYLPPSYRLILIGDGPDFERTMAFAKKFIDNEKLSMLGRIKNENLLSITSLGDVGVVCYPFKGLNNIYCASNKLFEYAQSGLPIVATAQPTLRATIERFKIGELIEESYSQKKIAEILEKVVENKEVYQRQFPAFLRANRWKDEERGIRKIFKELSC